MDFPSGICGRWREVQTNGFVGGLPVRGISISHGRQAEKRCSVMWRRDTEEIWRQELACLQRWPPALKHCIHSVRSIHFGAIFSLTNKYSWCLFGTWPESHLLVLVFFLAVLVVVGQWLPLVEINNRVPPWAAQAWSRPRYRTGPDLALFTCWLSYSAFFKSLIIHLIQPAGHILLTSAERPPPTFFHPPPLFHHGSFLPSMPFHHSHFSLSILTWPSWSSSWTLVIFTRLT